MASPSQPPQFTPVGVKARPELIADQLRAAIASGSLIPDQQLGEAELARAFGVSRNPLREAMARLVAEGLLRNIPHRGIFVVNMDDDDVRDIYRVRRVIEGAAAELIIISGGVSGVASLREACNRMVRAVTDSDHAALTKADHDFHTALVAESGSRRLVRSAQTLMIETQVCIRRLEERYEWPMEAVQEHIDIVDAIERRDLPQALEAIDRHMRGAVALLSTDADGSRGSGS
jgi:DNA-binding GntR family transcriptional regulator